MKKISTFIAAVCLAVSSYATSPSGTLPVLHIDTENHAEIVSKDDYLSATYWLEPNDTEGVEALGSAEDPLPLQIRGRGNYTWWGFDKKPYRLKLGSKAPLAGCKKSKHFALLAHADDTFGFLRNAVGLELSRTLGLPWTPADKPVEVVLNGSYHGLYFLTETIRVDSDRVDIVEQADNETDPEAITGGWLVEIDNYGTDPHVRVNEYGEEDIIFTYKTPEVLSEQQRAWLYDEMTFINSMIYNSDKSQCLWADYIDLDALARFYIAQEIVDDYESFHGSCYLYRDKGYDQKWMFGPVWDFGSSFFREKSKFIYQDPHFHQTWIGEMRKFPAFNEVVERVWKEFVDNGGIDHIIEYVGEYTDKIASAALSDAERWPSYGNPDMAERGRTVSDYLDKSCRWLDRQWGGYMPADPELTYHVVFEDNGATPWAQVYAFVWDGPTGYVPLGGWPGSQCTPVAAHDYPAWEITFTTEHKLRDDAGLIFGNGGSGVSKGNQTEDFLLVNNSTYRREGFYSGVENVTATAEPRIVRFGSGSITFDAPFATTLRIATPDGRATTHALPQGRSTVSLAPGIYIVAGRKIAL